jgi:hypothetical protein
LSPNEEVGSGGKNVNAAVDQHTGSLYEHVTIDDIGKDDGSNNHVGINGIPWDQMHCKHLRMICSRLSEKGIKNAEKAYKVVSQQMELQFHDGSLW